MVRLTFHTLVLGMLLALPQLAGRADVGFPLFFEAQSQTPGEGSAFVARGPGYMVSVLASEIRIAVAGDPPPSGGRGEAQSPSFHGLLSSRPGMPDLQRLIWSGANLNAQVRPTCPLRGRINRFEGSDPAKWQLDKATYGRVEVQSLYPGIDLVYYGNQHQLECDLIASPGADLSAITLDCAGSGQVHLAENGDLVLLSEGGELRLCQPQLYQILHGKRLPVAGNYRLEESGRRVRFEVGPHDHGESLVIDPVVVYNQVKGGSASEYPSALAADSDGNVYIAGYTFSADFPVMNPVVGRKSTQPGDPDAFVMKVDPSGNSLVYATYLGGSVGQVASDVAVDASRNTWVLGWTGSKDFPVANALQAQHRGGTTDVFIAKLDATGSKLLFSTFLGGSGQDFASGLKLDSDGNAYITGTTASSDLPVVNAAQPAFHGATDAFVAKLDAAGTKWQFLSYLGGTGVELASGLAVTSDGRAVLAGTTASSDFPLSHAWQSAMHGTTDVYIAEFSTQGTALSFSTFLGGNLDEFISGVAVGPGGDIWLTGTTSSSDFPTLNAFQPAFRSGNCTFNGQSVTCSDAFITRMRADGQALIFSTFLGGSGVENPTAALSALLTHSHAIAVDSRGFAYVTGITTSPDFPLVNPIRASLSGDSDMFVTKIHPAGALVFSTYGGGPLNDAGTGIIADDRGNIILTGWRQMGSTGGGGGKRTATQSQNDIVIARLFELPVSAAVPSGPLGFTSSHYSVQGGFDMTLSLDTNRTFVIEASTNLIDWTPLKTQ